MTNVSTAMRALVLGVATGGRTTAGITALAATSGHRWATITTSLLASGEVVADKLAKTPSRLDRGPLAGRIVLGTVGAGLLARRVGQPLPVHVALGGLGAWAGSLLGARYRAVVAERGLPDLPCALVEDGVVVALAGAAVR